ncbi:arginine repressor [Alkaliflexus imshenetskii]|uniref:arginine repressor n=1 Tax=Alkaliflexus imshenetskii TaxID=286730 RepID=UPI00047E4971|nr:ArgR family transcriptional regulator [Alkaliflexus imshenetskii]
MKIKTQRLNAIVNLIENHKVGSQEDLLILLEKGGFKTTQATLSRDLKALKVAKQPDQDGGYVYVLPDSNDQDEPVVTHEEFPLSGILSIEFSGNLAIMKTRPGFANGVASVIDSHGPFEILGTIAGDDTILIISRESVSREEVIDSLSLFVPGIGDKIVL